MNSVVAADISHLAAITLLMFSICCVSILYACPDTTNVDSTTIEAILFIGHLNPDCLNDTIIASSRGQSILLPHRIMWGQKTAQDSGCIDTVGGAIADSLKLTVAYLTYPAWRKFSGTTAMFPADSDSLDDLLLYIWGETGDTLNLHDTAMALCILGQHGMNTIDTIETGDIDSVQTSPFHARRLYVGIDFLDPDVRDVSGDTSYVLRTIPSAGGGGGSQPYLAAGADEHRRETMAPQVRIYPNPTHRSVRVIASLLPGGSYSLVISSADGREIERAAVEAEAGGTIAWDFDLSTNASGLYMVHITGSRGSYGSFPVVMTK